MSGVYKRKVTMRKSSEEYGLELAQREIDFNPLEPYVDDSTPILHECFNSHIVRMTPNSVLQGTKCSNCSTVDKDIKYKNELVQLNIPYIPLELYIGASTPIYHACPFGHENWLAAPVRIKKGHGCPKCNRVGGYNTKFFSNNPDKAKSPGILYLVALINKDTSTRECLKIGITKGSSNKDILRRAGGFIGYEVRVLKMHKGTLLDVFNLEQKLHKYWKDQQYIPLKKFGGWTELFSLNDDIIRSFPNIPENNP